MHPGEGAAIGGRSRNENIRMTSQVGDPLAFSLTYILGHILRRILGKFRKHACRA
jgi:hypothetical protein